MQKTPREICPAELRNEPLFKRVTFRDIGKLSASELGDGLNEQRQVLCIVNTRAAAQELYGLLEEEGRFHLSTLMPPVERQNQLRIIRKRLEDGLTCRVVSTSLIEAGVDVDFPSVYRELVGLDSILQAAGRCNRNGGRAREDSVVRVFTSDWRRPQMLETAVGACQFVWNETKDPSDEALIRRYFKEYLFLKGDEAQDIHGIVKRETKSGTLPFEEIARSFTMIESNAVTVYIPTEESIPLIEQYRSGMVNRTLMRKLGRFGVTVYPDHLQKLLDAGDVEALGGDAYVLLNEDMYNKQTGLSVQVDQGKAIFL